MDLIDRLHEELWTEDHDIVQEAVINTTPKKKKCIKTKWLSEETLQIAEKIGEAKDKERRKDVHLNAKFQRVSRRDKKAFLRNEYKEAEENNRVGKDRDFFKKIRNTKGIFHANMGRLKDRNGMDLREAEDNKKRWQEYTEELLKKIIMTKITMMV